MNILDTSYIILYTKFMTIFIGADHRGFELKNKLIEYLQEQNIRTEDMGNLKLDPQDDYPDFAQKVAQAVLQNPQEHLGVVLCGSGIGVSISTNRHRGIRCAVALTEEQVKHARENDHINILALPADYLDFEKAKTLTDIFISTSKKNEEKYLRRIRKLDEVVILPTENILPLEDKVNP